MGDKRAHTLSHPGPQPRELPFRDQGLCHQLTPDPNPQSLSAKTKETMALGPPLCLLSGSSSQGWKILLSQESDHI